MQATGRADIEPATPTQVCFVLLPRFNMMTLTMLMEPMRIANYLAPRPLYAWSFRGSDAGQILASNGLAVNCLDLEDDGGGRPDLIVVCGSWGAEHLNDQRLFRWLRGSR